jgi:alanyl-tRNA synthetase
MNSLDLLLSKETILSSLCLALKVSDDALLDKLDSIQVRTKDLEQKIAKLSLLQVKAHADEILAAAQKGKFTWSVANAGELDKETFTALCDSVSDAIKTRNLSDYVIVLAATTENRIQFFATAGQKAVKECGIHCGELVKAAAQKADGTGGGSPMRAQAGGKTIDKMNDALHAVKIILEQKAVA